MEDGNTVMTTLIFVFHVKNDYIITIPNLEMLHVTPLHPCYT